MPFASARCGHVSREPDEIREGYCASCGDWSPNAALAARPLADLEYRCRGCGTRFWVPEILAAGRRLEEDVAALRAGVTWYQRARLLAAAVLRSIIRPRLRSVPEGSDAAADSEHEDWTNPYSWRPGDPEL